MTRAPLPGIDRLSQLAERLREKGPERATEIFAVNAPLRICPLGAHVDHQGGAVTGLAVDRSVTLAAAPVEKPVFDISSLDFPGTATIDLRKTDPTPNGDWADYARAAVSVLSDRNVLEVGLEAMVGGDLPGSGLSSSAAVLISYLMALAFVNGLDLTRDEIAALVQQAENEFMGVASGRLDQSIILFAEPRHLTRVDCSNLDISQVPAAEGVCDAVFLIAFSGLSRTLAGSAFNLRVDECRRAARSLLELGGTNPDGDPVLSMVGGKLFEAFGSALPEDLHRRALHYFSEQVRVEEGVEAWRKGDLETFGRLMTASGESSVLNYECGTSETIALWQALRSAPGVLGTRFSGAGFGGSCVALVDEDAAPAIIEEVSRKYSLAHPGPAGDASFHMCRSSGPARLYTRLT